VGRRRRECNRGEDGFIVVGTGLLCSLGAAGRNRLVAPTNTSNNNNITKLNNKQTKTNPNVDMLVIIIIIIVEYHPNDRGTVDPGTQPEPSSQQ
jgi:hypothetical protein